MTHSLIDIHDEPPSQQWFDELATESVSQGEARRVRRVRAWQIYFAIVVGLGLFLGFTDEWIPAAAVSFALAVPGGLIILFGPVLNAPWSVIPKGSFDPIPSGRHQKLVEICKKDPVVDRYRLKVLESGRSLLVFELDAIEHWDNLGRNNALMKSLAEQPIPLIGAHTHSPPTTAA